MKIALLLLSLLAVATARKRPRVHYGRVVSQSERESTFPFVVHIAACDKRVCWDCTGSLVSKDTVLTAAHCVCEARGIDVYFNSTKAFQGTKISVMSSRMERNYRCSLRAHQFQYDIATLKLWKPQTDIKPVRVDCRNERLGEPFTIIGFGNDERGNGGTLKLGHQSTIRCPNTISGVICSDVYLGYRDRIDYGDSGGPMLVWSRFGFKQLGIQVGGIKDPTIGEIQIYNRVNPSCQWILK